MPTTSSKICVACSQDVSTTKRVKDTSGNYYCKDCWTSGTQPATPQGSTFACSACRNFFGVNDVYADQGTYICKPCWKARQSRGANPVQSIRPQNELVCPACSAPNAAVAAHCSRCGTGLPGNGVAFDDGIKWSEIIVLLRAYAEHAAILTTVRVGLSRASQGVQAGTVDRERFAALVEQFRPEEEAATRSANAARDKLARFSLKDVVAVRDRMLNNGVVDQVTKTGLTADPLAVFAPRDSAATYELKSSGVVQNRAYTCSMCARAYEAANVYDSDGQIICQGCYSACRTPGKATGHASASTSLSGGYGRLTKGNVASNGRPSGAARYKPTSRATPTGYYIAITLFLTGVLGLGAGLLGLVVVGPKSLPVYLCLASLPFLGIGWLLGANACPKCHLLFTAVTLESHSLGSHTEVRREQRVARTYPIAGGPPISETRYEVDVPMHVERLVHMKRCTECGEVWLEGERRVT